MAGSAVVPPLPGRRWEKWGNRSVEALRSFYVDHRTQIFRIMQDYGTGLIRWIQSC